MNEVPLAPFEVLGVSPSASPDEVMSAYRVLAQIYHPDRYVDSPPEVRRESEDRMKALNQAYRAAQDGNLAMRPVANNGHRRGAGSGARGGGPMHPGAGVPWDVAVRARATAAVQAEQQRQARERAAPQGNAIARPRPPFGGPVLKGLGMARFTNNIVCTGCQSVQWLPADWRDRLDDSAFYCSMCQRLIFTR
ncbi:MAG TPA: J domain-containing protein [Acidimicrobiales bacterium]|nr:J domain-containing protein [Acidimicrobiales bacterium]